MVASRIPSVVVPSTLQARLDVQVHLWDRSVDASCATFEPSTTPPASRAHAWHLLMAPKKAGDEEKVKEKVQLGPTLRENEVPFRGSGRRRRAEAFSGIGFFDEVDVYFVNFRCKFVSRAHAWHFAPMAPSAPGVLVPYVYTPGSLDTGV